MSRAAPPADLTDLQLAQLARLAEIGMEIAEAAGRQARGLGEGAGPDAADPALSFSRAARAVRLTIALQQRLAAERAAAARGEAARRRGRIHARIEKHVQQAAEAAPEDEDGDAEAIERLSSAAWERLVETEDAELLDRPIEEVVARICADLGVAFAWTGGTFGPVWGEAGAGPLSEAATDSSPAGGGAGEGAAPILLPCPAEDGGGGPQGRRGPAARVHPPSPRAMSG